MAALIVKDLLLGKKVIIKDGKKQEIEEEIPIEEIHYVEEKPESDKLPLEEIDQTKYRIIKSDSNIYPPQNKVVKVQKAISIHFIC